MVDVVFPYLDQAPALPRILSGLPAEYQAIVADNGSTDGPVGVALARGAKVVQVSGCGCGAIVHTGRKLATGGLLSIMDVSGSLDQQQRPRLADTVDLQLGRRARAASVMRAPIAGPAAVLR